MGERTDWGKMAAMCGRSTPSAGNAGQTSSLYIYIVTRVISNRFYFNIQAEIVCVGYAFTQPWYDVWSSPFFPAMWDIVCLNMAAVSQGVGTCR